VHRTTVDGDPDVADGCFFLVADAHNELRLGAQPPEKAIGDERSLEAVVARRSRPGLEQPLRERGNLRLPLEIACGPRRVELREPNEP